MAGLFMLLQSLETYNGSANVLAQHHFARASRDTALALAALQWYSCASSPGGRG